MKRPILALSLALASSLAFSAPPEYWKYEVLHSFTGGADGKTPGAGLVEQAPGVFWGTTTGGFGNGSTAGTVFKFVPGARQPLVTQHAFSGRDGSSPRARLLPYGKGYLYGTTAEGGTSGNGVVFKISDAGFSVVHHMLQSEGIKPSSPLIRATNGKLYGVAPGGGLHNQGTLFRMEASGALTVLRHFAGGGVDGSHPMGPLVQHPNGLLYGVSFDGGIGNGGDIFSIDADGNNHTSLYSFYPHRNQVGRFPVAGLALNAAGDLLGTTQLDGPSYDGALFKWTPPGSFSVLHGFVPVLEGHRPAFSLLVTSAGKAYGTLTHTEAYQVGCGSIFSSSSTGQYETIWKFDDAEPWPLGCGPTELTLASDGWFYGTTKWGGQYGNGVIFRLRKVVAP